MRELRDILAEMMRRERLGLMRPLWRDWTQFDDAACEQWRLRADHLIRLLETAGITVARIGDPEPQPAPTSPVIWRDKLVGRNAERVVRKAADNLWQIATIEGDAETVEFEFTMTKVHDYGALVLTDHPEALKVKGLGRLIAAMNEIYRLDARAVEP